MVFIAPFIGAAALLSGFAAALPRPDSSINEPGVTSPDGTPVTLSDSAVETGVSSSSPGSSGSSYGSSDSSYGSSGSSSYGGSSGSYGSSDYGNSNSNYGSSSSDSNYGSSNYGGSDNSWSSSEVWSTSTSTAWNSYSTPSYGSGNSNWGGNAYNDCVQQCVASYGGLPPAQYTATATNTVSQGTGVTHTVIVAPTQGVLRYIPFALNASVGDTIAFMWGANNHTVTKSSQLEICNKTTDALFTSGEQNKDFVFTQVVNDTNPTFFYCGTPGHCQKGMFGIINPPNAFAASTSVSLMMPSLAQNSSDIAAYAAYTNKQTAGNVDAARWGGNIDMASMPDWSHQYVAENVMYTRTFLAANKEVLKDDGSVDLSSASGGATPLMIPQDLSVALKASTDSGAAAPQSASAAASSTSDAASAQQTTGTGAAENSPSGAISVSSPKIAMALVAAVATLLML